MSFRGRRVSEIAAFAMTGMTGRCGTSVVGVLGTSARPTAFTGIFLTIGGDLFNEEEEGLLSFLVAMTEAVLVVGRVEAAAAFELLRTGAMVLK